jgi:hypothetical protein
VLGAEHEGNAIALAALGSLDGITDKSHGVTITATRLEHRTWRFRRGNDVESSLRRVTYEVNILSRARMLAEASLEDSEISRKCILLPLSFFTTVE